jgi:hypothetical protein
VSEGYGDRREDIGGYDRQVEVEEDREDGELRRLGGTVVITADNNAMELYATSLTYGSK